MNLLIATLFVSFCLNSLSHAVESHAVDEKTEFVLPPLHTLNTNYVHPDQLKSVVQSNLEKVKGIQFKEGDLLTNLILVCLTNNQRHMTNEEGYVKTEWLVPENSIITFIDKFGTIIPSISSEKPTRLKRLDGKGFAKEGKDGSMRLATFRTPDMTTGAKFVPVTFLTMRNELRLSQDTQKRERLPIEVRGKDPRIISKTPHKPTPEEIEKIEIEKQRELETLQAELANLISTYKELDLNSLKDQPSLGVIKKVTFTIELLTKSRENKGLLDRALPKLKADVQSLKRSLQKQITSKSQEPLSQTDRSHYCSQTDLREAKQETKQAANLLLEREQEKERSKLNRPNADPSGAESFPTLEEVPQKVVSPFYIFQDLPHHNILDLLKVTTNSHSSFEGISISREELTNFITFLRDKEAQERELILDVTQTLGYSFDKSGGKGSHAKVSLGEGMKPIILSNAGRELTTEQLIDLKAALVQKGLLDGDSQ